MGPVITFGHGETQVMKRRWTSRQKHTKSGGLACVHDSILVKLRPHGRLKSTVTNAGGVLGFPTEVSFGREPRNATALFAAAAAASAAIDSVSC